MQKKKRIMLYDTTLRDGNQALGINFSLSDKLKIVEKLDSFGIHYIEGGWPNPTNSIDRDFYFEINTLKLNSKISVFGSTKRSGTKAHDDPFLKIVAEADTSVATIFGKSWDLHVRKILCCSLSENLDMIYDSVAFLKKVKDEVIFDAEHFFDGYKKNREYAIKTLEAAKDAGADTVVLCDTNGGILPSEFMYIFREVKELVDIPLGVHMHNDTGCAEANSFLAVEEGATHIQGTMNGLGERCGNANLCTIIAGLQLKKGYKLIPDGNLKKLTETSIFISEIANVSHDIRDPYVGESAFSHKGGVHIDGVRKVKESFEHIVPESVGNKRKFILSTQAGKATIIEKLRNLNLNLDKKDPLVNKVLKKIKEMESEGYYFEAAGGTFKLIVKNIIKEYEEPFLVKGFRVIEEKRENGEIISEATIKIVEKDNVVHTAAEGDGPVNALDNALRKALIRFFPSLREVKLEDYKVRVLDEREGTAAKVRVLIASTDGKEHWGTVGVSTNIIEASWIALIDSLKYKLMKDTQP